MFCWSSLTFETPMYNSSLQKRYIWGINVQRLLKHELISLTFSLYHISLAVSVLLPNIVSSQLQYILDKPNNV